MQASTQLAFANLALGNLDEAKKHIARIAAADPADFFVYLFGEITK